MSSYFRTFVDSLCEIIFERSLSFYLATNQDVTPDYKTTHRSAPFLDVTGGFKT